MSSIFEARGVVKQYTNHLALDRVDLSVPRGSIYGLLGPNGAGKTTLIRIINRITAPDSGSLLFEGRPMLPADVARIGYLPEERGLYKKMKIGEQALYLARLRGMSRGEALEELKKWFRRFEIAGWWDKKVEELSKGMAQKIQFIVTVVHRPELLIFDEPFSGFDPINTQLLKDEILALNRQGATVIFSTHNMTSVEEICDHITLINRSKNILNGRVDQIRRDWGDNRYRIEFSGDSAPLQQRLEAAGCTVEVPEVQPGKPSELHTFRCQLPQQVSVRELVALANAEVEMQLFRRELPSMNDIFIQAVSGQTPTQPTAESR